MPRISPPGRRNFSGFNHRFLKKTLFFRGQTHKSLFRFTTLNVFITSQVTSLNLYFMSNSSFPWSSLWFWKMQVHAVIRPLQGHVVQTEVSHQQLDVIAMNFGFLVTASTGYLQWSFSPMFHTRVPSRTIVRHCDDVKQF